PFASLGPALRREMLDLVRELHAERGMTVLMVTHHPDDARALATASPSSKAAAARPTRIPRPWSPPTALPPTAPISAADAPPARKPSQLAGKANSSYCCRSCINRLGRSQLFALYFVVVAETRKGCGSADTAAGNR